MRYVREFDGLRGVLSTLVVIAHLRPSWLIWVWGSMDIFFCMSGFLIGSLLLRSQDQSGFYLTYAWRRILRIWPSYFVLVVFCLLLWLAFFHLANTPPVWSLGIGTFQYFVFAQNTELWFSHLPFDGSNGGGIPFLAHCWSVALEEQFYVIAPVLCWLISQRRHRVRWATGVFVVAAVFGFFLRSSAEPMWGILPARFDGFAAGLLLAVILQAAHGVVTPLMKRVAWGVVLVSLLLLGQLYYSDQERIFADSTRLIFAGGVSVFAVLGAGSLALIYAHQGSGILLPLRLRLPVFLGEMSYSTYLWHIPVIWYSGSVLGHVDWLSIEQKFFLQLGLCFLSAYAAHLVIERPLLRYRQFHGSPIPEKYLVANPL